jgi:hypothetical protein
MATTTQRARFRADLGLDDDESVFTDAEIDDLFIRAGERYSNPEGVYACARLLGVDQLIARMAPLLVSYRQGESSEDPTPILQGLQALRTLYADALQGTASASGGNARIMGLRRKPTRIKEYPDA